LSGLIPCGDKYTNTSNQKAMKFKKALFTCVVCAMISPAVHSQAAPEASSHNINTWKDGLAIDGYDAVSYFLGKKAEKGKKAFMVKVGLVEYLFVSQAHADLFKADPSAYKPQYGGWCAYAMGTNGNKVVVDPQTFKVTDGKLYLFYNKYFNNTLTDWNKDETVLKNKADANWKKLYQ
jgi:hypothetical protein